MEGLCKPAKTCTCTGKVVLLLLSLRQTWRGGGDVGQTQAPAERGDVGQTPAPAERCLCILPSSLTPAGERQTGWPARACGPLNYKGGSLRPDLFSPLILPTTALSEVGWTGLIITVSI